MGLTFDEARALVESQVGPSWPGPGHFATAALGYEDDTFFLVVYGAREWLVGQDPGYMAWDTPLLFVRKDTGHVEALPPISAEGIARMGGMTEVRSAQ